MYSYLLVEVNGKTKIAEIISQPQLSPDSPRQLCEVITRL